MKFLFNYIISLLGIIFILFPMLFIIVMYNLIIGRDNDVQNFCDYLFNLLIKFIKMDIITTFDLQRLDELANKVIGK